MNAAHPRIALTMGDAGGVGPELISRVLASRAADPFIPVVIGDPAVMRRAAKVVAAPVAFSEAELVDLSSWSRDEIPALRPPGVDVADVRFGETGASSGAAAGACLAEAFELAQAGHVDGVVSAPLSKESFHSAGYTQIDELEYLGELTSSEPFLVGIADGIWTAAVTLHKPLRTVADLITRERVFRAIDVLLERWSAAARKGNRSPLPRSTRTRETAAARARGDRRDRPGDRRCAGTRPQRGRTAPADTVFVRAFHGDFAGVVCMYHDQANIARKLRGFARGATLFLGLPVICGTTAHGTAFDIAGRGEAHPGSLAKALSLVLALAESGDRIGAGHRG